MTVGVSEAIDVALRTILNPGDEVIYHEPCFVSYRPSIILAGRGAGVRPETRREDEFRLTRDMLEKAMTPRPGADAELRTIRAGRCWGRRTSRTLRISA